MHIHGVHFLFTFNKARRGGEGRRTAVNRKKITGAVDCLLRSGYNVSEEGFDYVKTI